MPTFTIDTVSHVIASGPGSWLTHVRPLLAHLQEANWLEVGSYEGRSALWTLDNVLPPPRSTVTCVDPWSGWLVNKLFDENTAGRWQVVKRRGTSREILPTLPRNYYHGAYVDGSHTLEDVLFDVEHVVPLLRPPAVIVFDDYAVDVPAEMPLADGVRAAVDSFLTVAGERVEVLHRGRQVIARVVQLTATWGPR